MLAGADSIDDLDAMRHGGMDKLFTGVRAPSTLGSFLRSFTWGNVRQLEKTARQMLVRLAAHTSLLPGAQVAAFLDVDSIGQQPIIGLLDPADPGHHQRRNISDRRAVLWHPYLREPPYFDDTR